MKYSEKYSHFFIDIDGVLWNQNGSIPQSIETLKNLSDLNKDIFLISNNAAISREYILSRLESFGFYRKIKDIYTTSYAVAEYFVRKFPQCRKVMVLGGDVVRNTLTQNGFNVIYPQDHTSVIKTEEDLNNFEFDNEIDAVVVGFDPHFDYFSSFYAINSINNGAEFFTMHLDRLGHFEQRIAPETGSAVKFIEIATGKKPIIIGKPTNFMFNLIKEKYCIEESKSVMIGDSMESDILMGINSGIDTILVLTGVNKAEDLENYSFKPKFILKSLSGILNDYINSYIVQ